MNEWLEGNDKGQESDVGLPAPTLDGARVVAQAVLNNPHLRIEDAPRFAQEFFRDGLREAAAKVREIGSIPEAAIGMLLLVHAIFGLNGQEDAEAFFGEKIEDTPEGFVRICDLFADKIQTLIDNGSEA